uniref:Secreted protein n=1 Tax=Peronospora matthiolae TaxID=2874970 RepID=A0AAV1V4D2_9STRA
MWSHLWAQCCLMQLLYPRKEPGRGTRYVRGSPRPPEQTTRNENENESGPETDPGSTCSRRDVGRAVPTLHSMLRSSCTSPVPDAARAPAVEVVHEAGATVGGPSVTRQRAHVTCSVPTQRARECGRVMGVH